MSDKQIIDAEFQVAERRLTVSWVSAVLYVAMVAFLMWVAYKEPDIAPALVFGAALIYPVHRLFGLLAAPRLQSQEVEQLAQRLRANARPGRERR